LKILCLSLVFDAQKGKFLAGGVNLPFCPCFSKRQNIRALQAALARLSITTKRPKANKVVYKIRIALEGNQLKRLHPSLKSPSAAP
jgi:hypothetical protein